MRGSVQFRQHIKPGFAGHLDIQENKIGLLAFNFCNSFFGIGSFVHYFYFRKILSAVFSIQSLPVVHRQ